ncbi:hypothetical protein FPE01S_01_15260 [Flavihumibacter petaseus NBRC 106054]|uniref:Uncharacterized protein n=2 Tax=Flavihumibacter TaxID=1004301 RepID=A0A0E9MYM6_9BACT|nr:hypothetical protein FPE01S_01_15260 [Flavihumibacter petaseus NBRC 106054]
MAGLGIYRCLYYSAFEFGFLVPLTTLVMIAIANSLPYWLLNRDLIFVSRGETIPKGYRWYVDGVLNALLLIGIFITPFIVGATIHEYEPSVKITPAATATTPSIEKSYSISPDSIIGVWTDGTNEFASFHIMKDSIYYTDQGESYPYRLKENTITIIYPDFTYKATLRMKKDTLVMYSEDYGASKFWRFHE